MTDIVERLRSKRCCDTSNCNCDEAADTITALRAENEKLRAALGDVHAAAGTNHLAARIARAALEEPTAA